VHWFCHWLPHLLVSYIADYAPDILMCQRTVPVSDNNGSKDLPPASR
jgi:hypothetical protein